MSLMNLEKLILILIIFSVPLGQFGKIPLPLVGGLPFVNVYLNDVLIPMLIFIWFAYRLAVKKELFLPPFLGLILLFASIGLLSLVNSFRWLEMSQFAISFLYWWRWVQYAMLYPIVYSLVKESSFEIGWPAGCFIPCCLIIGVVVFAILGIFQFLFFSDFSKYAAYGWDPHYYRLLSTFFDPNFAGILLVLGLILVLSINLEKGNHIKAWILRDGNSAKHGLKNFPKALLFLLPVLLTVSILLTFSRSTYLAFLCAIFFLGLIKSRRLLILLLIFCCLAFVLVPKVRNRVVGAVTLDATARARLQDWQKTYVIVKDNWLTGVGFNAFRYAKDQYGYFRNERGLPIPSGHSGAGADSSVLFVWATTGVFGLITYLLLYGGIWLEAWLRYSKPKVKPQFLYLTLIVSIPTLVIHSQFVNSLFFPWIMEWMWIVVGLAFGTAENRVSPPNNPQIGCHPQKGCHPIFGS